MRVLTSQFMYDFIDLLKILYLFNTSARDVLVKLLVLNSWENHVVGGIMIIKKSWGQLTDLVKSMVIIIPTYTFSVLINC